MPPRRLQRLPLVYWIAVVCLFAFAAWLRFSLPLDPLADDDTWGYLAPALEKLTGGNFVHEGRNFVYPGFLFLLLRFFGDFRAITIAQHLLGLAAGGLLLMTWRRAHAFAAAPRLNTWSHAALGLVAIAIFLVAGDPIQVEMQIRPEGVCAFLLSLNLWFAVEFITGALVKKRLPSVGFGIGVGLTAVLLASVKPSMLFLALISLLPVGFSILRPGSFARKIQLAAGTIAGALLLVVPEYFLSRNDYLSQMFLPITLFVEHADLIRDQMADDLRLAAEVPYSREWLGRVHAGLREEIAKSAAAEGERYRSLGFSPDYLMYRETSFSARLGEEFQYDVAALTRFYRFYYWRTWRYRPLAMLKKISRQMALFYAPVCPAYDRSKFLLLTESYQLGIVSLNKHTYPDVWKRYPPAVEFMSRAESLAQNAPPIVQPRALRRALAFLARAYLPLLVICLVVAAAVFLRRNFRQRLGWLAALTLFVFSYNVAASLEVAIVNTLEVPRYSTVQISFTLLAEFLAAWLLFEFLFQKRSRSDSAPA
jgi:hypothetical protein